MIESIDITEIRRPNGWSPIRRELGVQAFGINAWHGDVDKVLVGEHDELPSGHEELYVVVAGAARFTVDGEDLDAQVGTAVFVRDPASKRKAVATAAGTTLISVGGRAHAAYAPRAWEVNAEVFAMFDREAFGEAKEMVEDALTRFEERDVLTYNLACAEARLGETDDAIAHLREAIEGRPGLADNARADEDLESLRSDPRFAELIG
jgi:tetratricopeptide (TPR) repeat protein